VGLELFEKLTEREDQKEYRCLVLLRVLRCVAVCCNVSQSVPLGVDGGHQHRYPCFLLRLLSVPLQCLYLPLLSLQRHRVCVCVCVSSLDVRAHSSCGCQKGSRRIRNYSEVHRARRHVQVVPLKSYSRPRRRSAVASPVAAMCRVSCSHTQGSFV